MKAIINGKLVFPDRILDGTLLIEGERILAAGQVPVPEGAEIIDADGLYVGPGFVDQHSYAYQQYGDNFLVQTQPAEAAAAHLKHGTTSYIPSTDYGDTKEQHLQMIRLCVDAIENNPETSIAGIHLEGPFINRGYGSNSNAVIEYSDEFCEELFSLAAPYVRQCTYAPELPTAPLLEAKMRKYGITGAIGHTCASAEDIERAVAYGAKIATHLYDASSCSISLEKAAKLTQHPQECTANLLLSIPGLYYELICDSKGLHAKKYSVIEALRAGGEDHIVLISDAFFEQPMGADVVQDVSYDSSGGLCGSRLCIAMAARNFIRFTGADIRVTFKCASTNSAKVMGIYDQVGSLAAGKLANIVLVDSDFYVKKVIFRGEKIEEVRT